jgi:hypothetical protein
MPSIASDAFRRAGRLMLRFAFILTGALIVALALPGISFAAPLGLPAAVWADPDSGYWIELILVAIVTAVAGIVFNVRRKPDP